MAKKWRDLYDKIPAERRARIDKQVAQDLADMRLAELRRARDLTQQHIAAALDVNQAWVSKLERQTDMYISTLRSYVEALGGELEIAARFSNGVVRLSQFAQVSDEATLAHNVEQREGLAGTAPDPVVNVWTSGSEPSTGRHVTVWEPGKSPVTVRTPRSRTPASNAA